MLSSIDAVVRGALFLRARRKGEPRRAEAVASERVLVVIPARDEGARVAPTIASARGANVVLLLDGADAEAESAGRSLGARIAIKEPGGPTKAAALAWLAREHRSLIESADAVLLLDVGSTLAPSFFEDFTWPDDADAVQTMLHGGDGGAADSERQAQSYEDGGREAFGWNARLRGTGSAFRARTFLDVIPRLVTRVEDLEASLLLHGARVRMTDAVVIDEKPEGVRDAAAQRARWVVGRYELLVRRAPELARHIAAKPAEGAAFFFEIFGRPLSLTVPLRIAAGTWLAWRGERAAGAAIASTTVIDAALFFGRTSPRAALRLGVSWLLAAALIPRALLRWTRVERP